MTVSPIRFVSRRHPSLLRETEETGVEALTQPRPRIILLAFSCHPHASMEDRNGWNRALHAAAEYDVTVLTAPNANLQELRSCVPDALRPWVSFHAVAIPPVYRRMLEKDVLFYVGYRKWLLEAKRMASELHRSFSYELSHLVSICSYREPGYLHQLEIPFVWGPIGGTGSFPLAYLRYIDFAGGIKEIARNLVNAFQLRFSHRIHQPMRIASAVLAANQSTRRDLEASTGIKMQVDLETGLDFEVSDPRNPRSMERPFRILWAGRLRSWKGLPLLLVALSRIPHDHVIQLRVMGDGNCLRKWQRLARRLGQHDRIQWTPKLSYRDAIEHYRWADVFAFTSLRDTSGTGLLEAMASGAPIIGLNHQGAADIMTQDSSFPVSVASPEASIQGFTEAILRAMGDPILLKEKSDASIRRAACYVWSKRYSVMSSIYRQVIQAKSQSLGH